MRLSLPEHLDWLVLRRVRRGGVARFDGGYQDNGHPLGFSWSTCWTCSTT